MPTSFTRSLRYCAALSFAVLTLPASANCTIFRDTDSDAVQTVFKENNGYTFKNYEEVCSKLRKANAKIVIKGSYSVLSNRSFGWVNISVADKASDHFIINSFSQYITQVSEFASDDTARKQLWIAINDGLDKWDSLDHALAELNQARRAMRKTAARQ